MSSTKYYHNQRRQQGQPQHQADRPITVSSNEFTGEGLESKDYYCNFCQNKLVILDPSAKTGEYFCDRCNIPYYPEHDQVRSKSKISTPTGYGDSSERDIAVSYPPEPITGRQPVKPRGTFEAMQKRGIKIKSYEERRGDGTIVNSYNGDNK